MAIPIVDEHDEIIGYKERGETTREDIRRISSTWVFNSKGEFLIARRQITKIIDPGKWGPSVAGTIEEGETYESNAVKETEEEIGVMNPTVTFFKKIFYETGNARRFCAIYTTVIDLDEKEFKVQEDEVLEVRWVSVEKLSVWIQESPDDFVPAFPEMIKLIKEYVQTKS